MANMARDHETAIQQDETSRLADVIGQLVKAGVLQWSSLGNKPVTQHGQLEEDIEAWIRRG